MRALHTLCRPCHTPGGGGRTPGEGRTPAEVSPIQRMPLFPQPTTAASPPPPQVRNKDAQSGRMVDDYWEASKLMLMDNDFLLSLKKWVRRMHYHNLNINTRIQWRSRSGFDCLHFRRTTLPPRLSKYDTAITTFMKKVTGLVLRHPTTLARAAAHPHACVPARPPPCLASPSPPAHPPAHPLPRPAPPHPTRPSTHCPAATKRTTSTSPS
jgi:hypothetical protein